MSAASLNNDHVDPPKAIRQVEPRYFQHYRSRIRSCFAVMHCEACPRHSWSQTR